MPIEPLPLLMDSTAAEETRNCKRARQTTPSAAGDDGDVDRISGLNDDVLLHILGLLGDVKDVVRTGTLSRRWLGLWTRVPALRFTYPPMSWRVAEQCAGHNCSVVDIFAVYRASLERYVSYVNDVLSLRTAQSDCAVESLAISYAYMPASSMDLTSALWHSCIMEALMPPSVDAMQGWIRYALQHGVKSFSLDMRLRNIWHGHDRYENNSLVFLDVLPGSGGPERLEAMWLSLGGATLRLPAAMKFTSLVDLSLEWIMMEVSSVHLLARLVSSASCPRLRKLRMRKLCVLAAFLQEIQLELESDMLSELRIEEISCLASLKLRTPSLKVLYLCKSSYSALTVSAPMLEELEIYFGGWLVALHVDGDFPCMRSLKIYLTRRPVPLMHCGDEIETSIQLLKHCTSLTCLDVTLSDPNINEWDVDIIKSGISLFPHITSLTVSISRCFGRHAYGASMATLLTRFNNLRRLSLHLHFNEGYIYSGLDHLCDHQQYHWKHSKFSMAHLQEVELTGLTGTDCELWFMKTVLVRAKRLHKVAIRFYPKCLQHEIRMDSFEGILLNEGMWTFHRDAFTLICVKWGLV